jgi:ppGpp synthetase/RelA/SpoT-type nucleotidyltranferase
MGEEDSVKHQDQEGYRSLWEMLQSPVRYTIHSRNVADLEITDDLLNILRVG